MAHRDGIKTLPSSLVEFLTGRIERLAEEERVVLRAVAVAGGAVSHTMLAAMLPDMSIGPIVRSLYDASILVIDGSDYTFWHPLLRAAILRDLLPFEAEDLHRRAAEAIVDDLSRGSSPSELANLAHRLAELAADGVIGEANHRHFSIMGYILDATGLVTVTAPELGAELAADDVDLVLLVPV